MGVVTGLTYKLGNKRYEVVEVVHETEADGLATGWKAWTVTGAEIEAYNGDYYESGYYGGKRAYYNPEGETWLVWDTVLGRWVLWYSYSTDADELPGNPWLQIGGGATGLVVTRATDWYGYVTITVQYYPGKPLYTVDLEERLLFCAFVLREVGGNKYTVGIWHPAWGRDYVKSPARELPFDHTFTTHWQPGTVTVQESGVGVGDSINVTIVELVHYPEINNIAWRKHPGTFTTDTSSQVKWYNGATDLFEDMAFVRDRATDKDWNGCIYPSYVTERRLYYKQSYVTLEEGEPKTLNLESGTLVINTGTALAISTAILDQVAGSQTPSDGQVIVSNTKEGDYNIAGWAGQNKLAERLRARVYLNQTTTVTIPDLTDVSGADRMDGHVWQYAGQPAAGIGIYACEIIQIGPPPIPPIQTFKQWVLMDTTDADGVWHVDNANMPAQHVGLYIVDPYWGTIEIPYTTMTDYNATDTVLSAYIHGWRFSSGGYCWDYGVAGEANLPTIAESITVKDVTNGQIYGCTDSIFGGWQTVSRVRGFTYRATPDLTASIDIVKRNYKILADGAWQWGGTLRGQGFGWLIEYGDERAMSPIPPLPTIVGGKVFLDVWKEDWETAPDPDEQPELFRIGVEHGILDERLEQVFEPAEDLGIGARYSASWCGNECPYCRQELWPNPDHPVTIDHPTGAVYGWCTNSVCNRDGRSYFRSFVLAQQELPRTHHIRVLPNRRREEVAAQYWYYPADYDNDIAYDSVTHITLASWLNDGFVDGSDYTAVDNNIVDDFPTAGVEVGMRPKILPMAVMHDATYEIDVEYANGLDKTLTFRLDQSVADVELLSNIVISEAENVQPRDMLLITDVTDIRFIEGDYGGAGNGFVIVADVPCVFFCGVPVVNQTNTPYAFPLYTWQAGGTVLYRDPTGVLWNAEADGEEITVSKRLSPWAGWDVPVTVTTGDYAQPGLSCAGDNILIVRALRRADRQSYQWHSQDGGVTWVGDGAIT